ncbi:MAG: lamin tail domain-containing protein [Thermomicrobiales bacterium]|nr:lamin tail domain-containing protein [Thermomicrobiales bacterium]
MLSRPRRAIALALTFVLLLVAVVQTQVAAEQPANEAFQRTWARTDKPVADGAVSRTWMWGPQANTAALVEDYAEAPDHERTVQYFDKSRMEVTNDASIAADSPWYVTNGLLVVELMTGEMQVGDDTFVQRDPAEVQVAGDPGPDNGPTYADLADLRSAPATEVGEVLSQRVDSDGNVGTVSDFAAYGVTAAERVQVPGIDHTVASVFWSFMNSTGLVSDNGNLTEANLFENPYYATGYPITEAYWTIVSVGGVSTDVLLQCFERRCLTYTPGNSAGWQVEAGNVGLHYYAWRYDEQQLIVTPTEPAPTPTPSPAPTAPITDGYVVIIESVQTPGPTTEQIMIWNKTPFESSVNMQGWTLSDEDGHVYTFPDVTVKAGFYVTVNVCNGEDVIKSRYAILYWGLCQSVADGDTVTLRDAQGRVADTYP